MEVDVFIKQLLDKAEAKTNDGDKEEAIRLINLAKSALDDVIKQIQRSK